eukprot:c21520_g1_i1 orf=569-1867(-)
MARGRKFKRGGAAKAQAEAAESKPVEESVETPSEDVATDVTTPQEPIEAPVVEGTEPAEGAETGKQDDTVKSEVEKTTDTKETPKKGNRKRLRGKKGKKPDNADATPGKKPEKKIIDFAGLIFMCNSDTKKDCFKYRVFGLPEGKKNIVEQVKKGTKLFLFDIDKRVLHGVYKASSEGGINLIDEAFKDSKRKFPAQVRFHIQKDCMPLDESAFKIAIKENYFGGNKFKCELNVEQVGRLMKLFRPLDSRGLPEPKPAKESKRDNAPRGKAPRAPPRPQRNRGPPHRFSAPAPPRERVYKEYAPAYPRERHVPEVMQPSYALVPDYTHAEAELLRQRHLRQVQEAKAVEALDRRAAYLLDPVLEASIARKRYLEDVYAAEQQALVAKRPLIQDTLYRDLEYQREAPYRSYGDGLQSLSAALPYDPRASHYTW